MANIGNPFTPVEKKVVLCGSGELGKEIAIELEPVSYTHLTLPTN